MTFFNNSSPSNTPATPVFNYSSRDYVSILNDLVARIPLYLPEWTSNSINDFGIVLLQMFAYVGDILGYYEDRLAGEAFIQTATQAASILNLAAMLDYTPTLPIGAVTSLQINLAAGTNGPYDIPQGSNFSTLGSVTQAPIIFTTLADLTIAGANGATPSLVGTVQVQQGTTFTLETVASSNGAVNQAYPLNNSPVGASSGGTPLAEVFVDIGLGPQEWFYAQELITFGPFDQVYTNLVDANGVFYIVFGDGVNGLVPPLGSPITCTYQTTVGSVSNVGAGTIVQSQSALPGVVSITNPTAANGGADAESLTSIQTNAPAALKTLNRAVTVQDFETLALQVGNVEYASAIEQTYQLVNLYICPFGGGTPTVVLQDGVLDYINERAMANTTVNILSPTYIGINIFANVVAYPNYGNTQISNAVATAINQLLSLPNTGFGFRVGIGLVYQTILAQQGVNYATVTGLTRSVLCTLTSPLTSATPYTALTTSPLPQPVLLGDSITITNLVTPTPNTQTFTATAPVAAGATSIPVSFTANANYPILSTVADTSGFNDAVLLPNEIPVLNLLSLTVSGGITGS